MTAMIMTRMVTIIKVIVVCCLMTNDYDYDDESLMTDNDVGINIFPIFKGSLSYR